jgi:hypothetical protein
MAPGKKGGEKAAEKAAVLKAVTKAADAADARAGLRDRLCAGKPGKVGDYRLRLSATCVATAGAGKASAVAAAKAARERKAAKAGTVPSAAATRAEIRILEREMAVAYPDKNTRYDKAFENGGVASMSHHVMRKMMDPRIRLLTPDPLVRYNKLAELLRKAADDAAKKPYFDVRDLPRHTILSATLAHLSAIL